MVSDESEFSFDNVEQICEEYRRLWKISPRPPMFARFYRSTRVASPDALFAKLLSIDVAERNARQIDVESEYYNKEFPDRSAIISHVLNNSAAPKTGSATSPGTEETFIAPDAPFVDTNSIAPRRQPKAQTSDEEAEAPPEQIGRYSVERVLGAGGYGQVFLARDTHLERHVAIKLPHRHRLDPEDVDKFLAEARTLASLDHPAVVPIYDFDRFKDRCYVVSKYIEGETLSQRIKRSPMAVDEVVRLLHRIAETLNYIHLRGIVHRDVKPSNLLLERNGNCFITDFGLALRDFNYGRVPGQMGTMSYMSPEQARGESHLVDGRSDLFSLGVVMYEMLTGARPFTGKNWQAISVMICYHEPRPLRQRINSIPKELERICLKLLSKRANDRYLTGQDLADDLQHFLVDPPSSSRSAPPPSSPVSAGYSDSRQQLVGIIPRGLRSFDREDSIFFRELLPGPRDRDGLPDSLSFWKRRIESSDIANLFRVGVIYGPSGSGKSSFVKAGLLPTLESRLTVAFIEASSSRTEQRLRHALAVRCPDLPPDLTLVESLAWMRREGESATRHKVLIVIDQFEQWLHGWDGAADAELAVALRQCDGRHVQCVLLVRDDFWLAVSRFAATIEVDLVQASNLAMVDLFDKRHARKVLAEYGRGYARLPDNLNDLSKNQNAFLDQAVDGLAEGEKVIPVQLATFSEIMKGRDWDVKSLNELGGVKGVGVQFLEESFSTSNAPVQNRTHEKAAQAILNSLLPEAGTNIKGAMRSESELQVVSNCTSNKTTFSQLMQILDTELRLITPTESDDRGADGREKSQQRYYQLTHDFLVPAVRRWLERRQQLTLTGRATMRLADRTEVWTARPEKRHLPSWLEWISFLLLTRPSQRDKNQQSMMSAATRRHTLGTLISLTLVLLLSWSGLQLRDRSVAIGLTEQLTTAADAEVGGIIDQLTMLPSWSHEPLTRLLDSDEAPTQSGLRARMALLRAKPSDESLFGSIETRLFTVDFDTLAVLRDEMQQSPQATQLTIRLWNIAESLEYTPEQRFRAAFLLATYQPPVNETSAERWTGISQFTCDQVILRTAKFPGFFTTFAQGMYPAKDAVLPHIRRIFGSAVYSVSERQAATSLLISLLKDNPVRLADASLDADDSQLDAFAGMLNESFENVRSVFADAVTINPDPAASPDVQETVSNRQVNAAVLLMRQNQTAGIWDLLQHSRIPNTRSGLIERFASQQVDLQLLLNQLDTTKDSGIVSALLLSLGTFSAESFSESQRVEFQRTAQNLFKTHPAADVHSAAEWALKKHFDDDWTDRTRNELSAQQRDGSFQWSIAQDGMTLVRIDDSFEIGTTEVTLQQFLRFRPDHKYKIDMAPELLCPAIQVSWVGAVEYCQWRTLHENLGEENLCYVVDETNIYRLHTDYLSRNGYRLPTSEEWERATMGDISTRYFFGHRQDLNVVYSITSDNSSGALQPAVEVGLFKPNQNGLFDTNGNMTEWCSETAEEIAEQPNTRDVRPVRGAQFNSYPEDVTRLTRTGVFNAKTRFYSIGFRLARSRVDE